jgi:hypothetical protein
MANLKYKTNKYTRNLTLYQKWRERNQPGFKYDLTLVAT